MTMNLWYVTAAVLMFGTTGLHVFGGGPEIHVPIQASELSDYLRALSAVLWHAVTVILIVFTVGYAVCVKRNNEQLIYLMGAVQIGFSGLFVYYGLTLLGTVWLMPQWVIFLSITGVSALGLRYERRRSWDGLVKV